MADGYSKIKAACKFKSRSIDYSDLSSLPHSLKFNADGPNPGSRESDQSRTKWTRPRECFQEEEEEEEEEENAGGALSRSSSVCSSSGGFHSAVKRALSMRRSSSVAERYCRIHDQFATALDEEEGGGGGSKEGRRRTGSEKKKRHVAGKIVKACKRLFGL